MLYRDRPDGEVVHRLSLPDRGVYDQVDLAVVDQVEDVRAPLVDFEDGSHLYSASPQRSGGALGCDEFETQIREASGNGKNGALVAVLDAQKQGPFKRKRPSGRDL